MRVFTCTPVRFKGDHTFFARDSGLLSVGLTLNGIESRSVMPGPAMSDDDPRLIRTSYSNLEKPEWWKEQSVDAVVFFSWAMPEHAKIAKAIKQSGAKLVVFLDSAGFWSPWSEGGAWFKAQWNSCRRKRGIAAGTIRFGASLVRSCIPRAFDKPRLDHMNLADAVTVTSPTVLERTKNYAKTYGYNQLMNKIHLLPLPVATNMIYADQKKQNTVICVARWLPQDWAEKGPKLLLSTLELFLKKRPDYRALVVGRGALGLTCAPFYPTNLTQGHLRLIDYLPNKELTPLLAASRISVCSSFHESYHIASFEAACCGCSIVALKSPDLPALQFLAETNGTLALRETPEAFAQALLKEAAIWDQGQRLPESTSRRWQAETHADRVAAQAIELLRL